MLNRVTRLPQRRGVAVSRFHQNLWLRDFSPTGFRDRVVAHDYARDQFLQCLVLAGWRYALIALHLRLTVLSVIHDG